MTYSLLSSKNSYDSNEQTYYRCFETLREAVTASQEVENETYSFNIRNDKTYSSLNNMWGLHDTSHILHYSQSTGIDPADDPLLQFYKLETNFCSYSFNEGTTCEMWFVLRDYSRHGLCLYCQEISQEVQSNSVVMFIGSLLSCKKEILRLEKEEKEEEKRYSF